MAGEFEAAWVSPIQHSQRDHSLYDVKDAELASLSECLRNNLAANLPACCAHNCEYGLMQDAQIHFQIAPLTFLILEI
ncbi:hypothetical protein AAW31_12590 [Nitrosomonas communis]|uniref:Uncharacterized protein n=1 Tax=Nitrosomonas communis TaxID=44574 RepID=A0A0F7KHT8_9PROT|nr:hypothetical protein AAW31_12590 [Nitrosomonas communis]